MSQYFLKPYERFSENVKVEIDLSNCARKADFFFSILYFTSIQISFIQIYK